jgi:hypothetical protein
MGVNRPGVPMLMLIMYACGWGNWYGTENASVPGVCEAAGNLEFARRKGVEAKVSG